MPGDNSNIDEVGANPEYQGQIIIDRMILHSIPSGAGDIWSGPSIDLTNKIDGAMFQTFAIEESMENGSLKGAVIINDAMDNATKLPIKGEEWIELDLRVPGSQTTEGEEDYIVVPPLLVYKIKELHEEDLHPSTKQWKLFFSSIGFLSANWDETHLNEDFMGSIHEYVKKIIKNNSLFSLGTGWGEEYEPDIEETANSIWKRQDYYDYRRLRKVGSSKVHDLLAELAKNAISKENINAANFFFWQDLKRWRFRSVESLLREEPKKTYFLQQLLDPMPGGDSSFKNNQIISPPEIFEQSNQVKLVQDGAIAASYYYYRPRINVELYPYWMAENIDTFYYKVNCQFRDRFPAAIYGFRRANQITEADADKHRWLYAFAEVYLEYDYETHTPLFKIKPLNENPIRSTVAFTPEGVQDTEDPFFEPAHNTMEIGNDFFYDYDKKIGWEAPGIRIDTETWKDTCVKLQPIRGSFPITVGPDDEINNVTEALYDELSDDGEVNNILPVVEMKIYKDVENKPHYFFTAENAVDGECDEDAAGGDCPEP